MWVSRFAMQSCCPLCLSKKKRCRYILTIRMSLTLRTIPLVIYCLVLAVLIFRIDHLEIAFDFWTPMINFPANLVSWVLAGIYVVLLCLLLAFVRLLIIRFSFSSMNRNIPHTDRWENIQLVLMIFNIIIPIIIGFLYSFALISAYIFQFSLSIWIFINFIPDFLYYIWWLIIDPSEEKIHFEG